MSRGGLHPADEWPAADRFGGFQPVLRSFADGALRGSSSGTGVARRAGAPRVGPEPSRLRRGARCSPGGARTDPSDPELDAIALDLPGFGATPAPVGTWGTADYAQAVAPVFTEMSRPVVVLGHSFGGRVALTSRRGGPSASVPSSSLGCPWRRHRDPRASHRLAFRLARAAHRRGVLSDKRMEAARRDETARPTRAAEGVMRQVLVATLAERYERQLEAITCPGRPDLGRRRSGHAAVGGPEGGRPTGQRRPAPGCRGGPPHPAQRSGGAAPRRTAGPRVTAGFAASGSLMSAATGWIAWAVLVLGLLAMVPAGLRWLRVARPSITCRGLPSVRPALVGSSEPLNLVLGRPGIGRRRRPPFAGRSPASRRPGPRPPHRCACRFGVGARPLQPTRRLRALAVVSGALAAAVVVLRRANRCSRAVRRGDRVVLPVLVDIGCRLLAPIERGSAGPLGPAQPPVASSRWRPAVVGITGSYGKTSTKQHPPSCSTGSTSDGGRAGAFNNRAGLSRAVNEQLVEGTKVFIAEMGTYGPGEIAELCRGARRRSRS